MNNNGTPKTVSLKRAQKARAHSEMLSLKHLCTVQDRDGKTVWTNVDAERRYNDLKIQVEKEGSNGTR
jgi:hypothetical protein